MAAPVRQIPDSTRGPQPHSQSFHPVQRTPGLDLGLIVQGVLENWDSIEETLPRPAVVRPVEEASRQNAVEQLRPRDSEKDEKKPTTQAVEAEEFAMLGPGIPPLGIAAPKQAKKPEEKEQQASAKKEEAPATGQAEAVASKAQDQQPRQEGQPVPQSFAIPNHSAGASGFGNTWSHAAKQANAAGSEDNVIHSE